ncbi:apolipoprotein A-II [Corythoichthys intestinalis]|uniref:apolipoprotein A-II n=1 Tax=Corythoichthys intestinalis TaxID=161448 RepID=UPI0025A5E7A8|nr:apolipoprotein A-II [Corythoichthys intestinalis]
MTCASSPPYIIWSRCALPVADNSLSEQTVTSGIQTQSIADMNAKYAIALILALQVSMSLCEVPAPDQELVDKVIDMRTTFLKRLVNFYGKMQSVAAPVIEKLGEGDNGKAVKEFFEGLQTKPELQAIAKVSGGIAEEITPLVDKARLSILGLYGHYARPYVGQFLSDQIDITKKFLDIFLPAE